MNPLDIVITNVDQLGLLLSQIKALTEQADNIKTQLKDHSSISGDKKYEGNLYNATYVEANRKVVDYKKLLSDLGVSTDTVAKYTSVTAVYSIKVEERN